VAKAELRSGEHDQYVPDRGEALEIQHEIAEFQA
jgi:hypothetical protein